MSHGRRITMTDVAPGGAVGGKMTPEQEKLAQEYRHRSAVDHTFHMWINQRQEARGWQNVEHDLYEWKSMLGEIGRLPHWLKQARTGTLPTVHQQCSHSAPEAIVKNRVLCALGVDVTECPILASLYSLFTEERAREQRLETERGFKVRLEEDDADVVAARVCTWHIFMSKLKHPHLDTSEGYVQHEGDRMYWSRVYSSLSGSDDYDVATAGQEGEGG
jgi:hypothetical protein